MPRRGVAAEPPPTNPRDYRRWLEKRKPEAERAYRDALASGYEREARIFKHAATQLIDHENPEFFMALGRMKKVPVTIDEFMDSPEFLGCTTDEPLMDMWPKLRPIIRAMNPDVCAGETPITTALMGGACHAAGTLILMYDGTRKPVEDVQVGDRLMGPDSRPRNVLSLARGEQEMFRITPKRGGEPFVVNRDHILSLERTHRNTPTKRRPDYLAGSTINIRVGDLLQRSKTFRHIHKLRRHAVDFAPGCALPIPPYLLGLWLGDGFAGSPSLCGMDEILLDEWRAYGKKLGLRLVEQGTKSRAKIVHLRNDGKSNALIDLLREAGVWQNKHIPHAYLTASRADRLELLAGLLDTDGHCYSGMYDIAQVRRHMAEDICFLARTLGLRASIATKVINETDYYRVKISGDVTIPCRLSRKQCKSRINRDPLLSDFDIESTGNGEYFGFELDGDHLYLTADLTKHHNTGWGKTHAALATMLYQVYLLSCFDNPHALFKLNRATTPIVFMFMTVSGTVTKRVLFQPFRAVWTSMPYARRWTTWDKRRESELILDNNVHIVPALASIQSMVGQAINSAIADEIAFMSIVEESKQVAGNYGMGGRFDQADIVFSNITRRRARSFTTRGISIGCICAPSSTRYKGDYIDQKMEEAEKLAAEQPNKPNNTLSMRYKQYDIAPLKDQRDLSGETFPLLVGTDEYPTRVLRDNEKDYPVNALVEQVPISYKPYFLSDPEGAARDVLGIASHSITPFFAQRHKIIEAILAGKEEGLKTYIKKSEVVLAIDGMPQIDESKLPLDRDTPRFVHIDLSSTVDCTGIAIVKFDGHTPIIDPQHPERYELMPKYVVEAAISIKPDSINQIDPAEIRKWVMQLATFYKFNIATVSMDSFQSRESLGLYRAAGIPAQEISVDKTSEPYRTFRSAVYEGRVVLPDLEHLRMEMISLEYLAEKDKIDHPPTFKKDTADAVCGALYACSRYRFIRTGNIQVSAGGVPQYRDEAIVRRDVVRSSGTRRR